MFKFNIGDIIKSNIDGLHLLVVWRADKTTIKRNYPSYKLLRLDALDAHIYNAIAIDIEFEKV